MLLRPSTKDLDMAKSGNQDSLLRKGKHVQGRNLASEFEERALNAMGPEAYTLL